MHKHLKVTYCGRFAQSIARHHLSKHVPTHLPCNNAVEVFLRGHAWAIARQRMHTDITQQCDDKQKKPILNLILILFKLRVRINHKEYPEYDIVQVLIIF
jgi:hypothetical protein